MTNSIAITILFVTTPAIFINFRLPSSMTEVALKPSLSILVIASKKIGTICSQVRLEVGEQSV